jgi:glycosyltransferase involved in cell wall biosynthesis
MPSNPVQNAPHVVHVIDELPPDGAERLIVDVLQNRSDRFRYSVVCIVAGGAMEPELAAIGVPVVVLGRRRGVDLGTVPALVKWFRDNDVSVVHTHLFAADSYGRVAAALAGVKGRFSTRHNTSSWKGGLRNFIARILSRLSTRVIACGAEVGRTMVDVEGLPEDRVTIISNGINLRRFDSTDRQAFRHEIGVRDTDILLGVVGRLHAQKGHLDLLQALARLGPEVPPYICALAGSGELRADIEEMILAQGLQDRVKLVGQRSDIPNVLAGLDILVMPSRWEGLPMALLEGMALAKPVVATAVGGIPDVIQDGRNGLLVPPGQPALLAMAMQTLMCDRRLRDTLGAAARDTVENHFNAAATQAAYEALYAQSLAASA